MELPISGQNALISRASYKGHLVWRMMPSQIATFRGPTAQCFYGIIALTVVTVVCFCGNHRTLDKVLSLSLLDA
jgi:hypothetical protein